MVGEPLPLNLAIQGGAMMRAAAEDFLVAGCRVATLIDGRCRHIAPQSVETTLVEHAADIAGQIIKAAGKCDAALIIAPETGGLLFELVDRLNASGVRVLNAQAPAIAVCTDKLETYAHLVACGVVTPMTIGADVWQEGWAKSDGGEPDIYVLKPRDGVGCEDTEVIDGPALQQRIDRGRATGEDLSELIVQPFCRGESVSAGVLIRPDDVIVMPPGRQRVRGSSRLSYGGNTWPLPTALASRAAALAAQAVDAIPGLEGYVGVDMMLANHNASHDADGSAADGVESVDGDVVIDINPRLTMSFVALRRMATKDVAPGDAKTIAEAWLHPDRQLTFHVTPWLLDHEGRLRKG